MGKRLSACRTSVAALIGVVGTMGCGPEMVGLELDGVSPAWGYNGQATPIILTGRNLYPGIEAGDASSIELDQSYRVWLQSDPPVELDAVDLIDYHRLSAVVPPSLKPGQYGLRVESPAGNRATLAEAFQVTDNLANHLRATADQLSWTVQETVVVRLQVMDLAEAIVPLPLEIRITAKGSAVTEESFAFVAGTLTEQSPDPSSGGVRGKLSPDGQGYVAFTSTTPGEVVLLVEPADSESIVDSVQQQIFFYAGEVMEVALGLPGPGFETTAGEAFDISVQLLDSLGNTVTGIPASVLLSETCPGGTASSFVSFVDQGVASVIPTSATRPECPNNRIQAIGVVEGGTVAGQSAGFSVAPGDLDHLKVTAAPPSITAGVDTLTVAISAVDTWSNPIATVDGEVTLSDESGPLEVETGNGSQSCGELSGGSTICIASLFEGGVGRVITATTAAGTAGTSNEITVLPGPVDHVETNVGVESARAGDLIPVTVQLRDAFYNPIEPTASDLGDLQFFDLSGPVSCVYEGSDPDTFKSSFGCTCTVAQDDNVMRAVFEMLGTHGDSTPFDVTPGDLATVDVHLSAATGGLVDVVSAGGTLIAHFAAFDAYGNAVEDDLTIEIADAVDGCSPATVDLMGGIADEELTLSGAITGNTISAMVSGQLLGISSPFDVVPGPTVGLEVELPYPWAWVGATTSVQVRPIDAHGNLTPSTEASITLSSLGALGPSVTASISGDTTVVFYYEAAGLNDVLVAEGGGLTGESPVLDVIQDCIGGPMVSVSVVGASWDSVCLDAGDSVTASIEVEPAELLVYHYIVGDTTYRIETASLDHTFDGAGRTAIRALGIRSDGCAEEAAASLHHGPLGPVVGPIAVSVTDGALVAGTTGGDERTRVSVTGRTCTGDLASGEELLIRTDLGALESTVATPIAASGVGLRLELDEDGSGTVRWTMADVNVGGTGSIYVGNLQDAAFGSEDVSVSGDSAPPTVVSVNPFGTGGGWFSDLDIEFSEPMLTSLSESTLLASVELIDPDGLSVPWTTAAWAGEGTGLTLYLGAPQDAGSGRWELRIFDELRDEAGNRLDGDFDSVGGGDLTLEFGTVPDLAPSVTSCQPSTALFRPDGDDGSGYEADLVSLAISTDGVAEWWLVEVTDADGNLVRHTQERPGGTASGSVAWDGRNSGGKTVANGLYWLEIVPYDEFLNVGASCVLAVRVDNRFGPLELHL